MRPLVIAVVLLSCAGDESRRTTDRSVPGREPIVERAPVPIVAAAAPPAPAPPPEAAPSDPRDATRKAAHDVLVQHCGECHEGHRSQKPQALAIFDLDLPDWPGRFNAHRFETALGRLQNKPAPAAKVFIAFRDAEIAASPDKHN
jgi:mono/diheme cytochrome c family protein